MKAADSAQTLSRGLDVLKYLAGSAQPRTSTEIAAALGLNRTVVYRLTGTLVEHGLVQRTEDGALAVGVGVLSLTENFYPSLREASRPILERLAEDLGATAHLVLAEGTESVAVCVVEPSTTDFHLAYRAGARHPLDRGALGEALRAAMGGQSGVFVSHGQLTPGATGVVAAVPDFLRLPIAIGVVGLSDHEWSHYPDRVLQAVDELVEALSPQSRKVPA